MMNKPAINRRAIGVNFDGDGLAHILIWAPKARHIAIRIDGEEDLPLNQASYGYWQLETSSIQPG
ncbi:MAG TPA: malto-oligosyltrehalose trehalohydrolase, partial [Mucilaginibacter sp.]